MKDEFLHHLGALGYFRDLKTDKYIHICVIMKDEFLHHLGALGYFRDLRWCKISSINSMHVHAYCIYIYIHTHVSGLRTLSSPSSHEDAFCVFIKLCNRKQ